MVDDGCDPWGGNAVRHLFATSRQALAILQAGKGISWALTRCRWRDTSAVSRPGCGCVRLAVSVRRGSNPLGAEAALSHVTGRRRARCPRHRECEGRPSASRRARTAGAVRKEGRATAVSENRRRADCNNAMQVHARSQRAKRTFGRRRHETETRTGCGRGPEGGKAEDF